MVVLDGNCAVGCGPACNGLPLNTYIAMYARTNAICPRTSFVTASVRSSTQCSICI